MSPLLFIHWNPDPNAITIGTLAIQWYGVMWGLGLLSCFFIGQFVFRKLNRDDEKLTLAIQYAFIGALIGARLAHILFYALDYYIANPLDILAVWKGGLASHGGAVGWMLGLYIFCRRNKEFSFFWLIDHGAILVCTLSALIRLGNLLNSELYGKPTDVPWAFIFESVDNIPRHPVVLYESIAYFLLQIIMLAVFLKYKESKPGIYLAVFFTVLFTTRFLLEFFKVPEGRVYFDLISKTQLLNLPFVAAGLAFFYLVVKGKLKYPQTDYAKV